MRIRLLYFIIACCCFGCEKIVAQKALLQQKFTLESKGQPIKQVLEDLETRGNFSFGYSEKTIAVDKQSNFSFQNKTLKQILKVLFPQKSNRFKQVGNKILLYRKSSCRKEAKNVFTISGYIRELGSLEYLSKVSIGISSLQIGTTTNEYGFFSLTIPEGTYELWINKLGYKPIQKEIELQNDVQQNFVLEDAAEQLDEVIINAASKTNESQKTQMSTAHLQPNEIQDIPIVLGEKDVIKTFQLLPGITSGTEGGAGFYVRGGTPDQNLILLDEAPVYNSNHLFGIFSVFNGDAIQSAEVYKGGFPAKYGGRLSSVLRLDTKNGNKEQFGGQYNIGLISSSFLLEGPLEKSKTSFVLSGRRTYLDALTRPFLAAEEETGGLLFSDITFKIHHVINEKNKVFWSNYFGEDKFFFRQKNDQLDTFSKIRWGNVTSTLRWNHEFNNKLFSNTSAIYSNYNFLALYEIQTSEIRASSGINDYGIKTDFSYYPNTNHDILLGASTTYHDFVPKKNSAIRQTAQNNFRDEQRIQSLESALYAEDQWSINTELNLTTGLRISHFIQGTKQYLRPEPRLSFVWKTTRGLAIKAAFTQMNQFIHLLSYSGVGLPTDLWVTSTNRIKPQFSEQISIGLVKDFLNQDYTLSLEGYYKRMRDIITYKEEVSFLNVNDGVNFSNETNEETVGALSEFDWENSITSGKGWGYGTEFLLRKRTGKVRGWLGYTLSWSQRQFNFINNGKKFNSRYDRRHDLSIVTTYTPTKKITWSANWILSSGLNFTIDNQKTIANFDNFPENSEAPQVINFAAERNNFKGATYHRLDLGVQFHKKKRRNRERTWAFSIYNVYNRKNAVYYIRENDELKKIAILRLVPSLSYTCKF